MSVPKNPNSTRNDAPPSAERALCLDTANVYQTAVGAEGITAAEVDTLTPDALNAHQTLIGKSAGGLDAEFACLNLHATLPDSLPQILDAAAALRQFQDIVVLGIGGSSLGAKAVQRALTHTAPAVPRLHFLENVDPDGVPAVCTRLRPADTALICISKSGGTIETVTQFLILRDWLTRDLGAARARDRQWLITDPRNGWLRALAERERLKTLPVPPRVGGRYSVLTAVGLLPLAAVGIDVAELLSGAAVNAGRCSNGAIDDNPALELAALFYLLDTRRDKRVSIMMPYVDPLNLFSEWYCQLWAESLGKRRSDGTPAGTLPVRALGVIDQHSQLQMYLESRRDKIFSFITLARWQRRSPIPLSDADRSAFPYLAGKTLTDILDAEFRATRAVINQSGHPNLTITLPALDAHALGQLIDLYQRATVYAGLLYGINPLDQPAVERGKQLARQYLETN